MFIIYDNQTPSMKKIFIKFKVSGKANYRLLHGSVQIIKKQKQRNKKFKKGFSQKFDSYLQIIG